MPEYELQHLHHETADVDATVAWYRGNFGAEVLDRFTRDGAEWAQIRLGDVQLNITDRADTSAGLRVYRGLDHFALSTDDFDASVAGLKANGVKFFLEPTSPLPGLRIAFIAGPDDIKIELISPQA